jgi:hypothetical protein
MAFGPGPDPQHGETWQKRTAGAKGVGMTATKQATPQRPAARADRQRRARRMAYLGCAAALGYGVLKALWALGSTVGRHGQMHNPAGLTAAQQFFDYWGTPFLAGLAVVILLGLVYPWGNVKIVRPLLRVLAWAGTLMTVVGVAGLIVTIQHFGAALSSRWLGEIYPATFLFVYICFLVLGVAFGVTAWLTRR